METTLAHLFPEMTANIAAPVLTILYLFVLDWRLALLSLVVFPVAFFFTTASSRHRCSPSCPWAGCCISTAA